MDNKLYFITDAHLGIGRDSLQRERELCILLDHIKKDAQAIFFLGDMFDFWFSYKYVVPRGFIRLLGKMAELADDGIELHYFTGNHDMWLFDYLPQQMRIQMHNEPAIMQLDNKTFLIGHGDGVGKTDKKFNILKSIFRNRVNQFLFSMLPSRMTFKFAHSWSDHNKTKHNYPQYLGDDKEDIVIYCNQQIEHNHIDYCVFGHRHNAIIKPLSDTTTYINAGDWLHNRDYAVYSNGEFHLESYSAQQQ